MSGADGITAELREPSFKGVISYWWRAANAHLVQGENLSELRKHEQILFGSTDQVSNFKVYISPYQRTYFNTKKLWKTEMEGLKYLWFFPLEAIKFKEGLYTTFEMTISTPNEELHKQAIGALWLAVMLGGFGNRARRGAGNISLSVLQGTTYNLSFAFPSNSDLHLVFPSAYQRAIELAKEIGSERSATASYLYPNLSAPDIWFGLPGSSQWQAMDRLGQQYRGFRTEQRPTSRRSPFGTPITGVTNNRQASPLFFSINQVLDKYFLVLTLLSGPHQDRRQVLDDFLDIFKSSGFRSIQANNQLNL